MGRNSQPSTPAAVAAWAVAVFSGFFILFVSTPTSNYTFDAVTYAYAVRLSQTAGPVPLLHPHHLLFSAIGRLFWQILRVPFPRIEPLAALQTMNAFAGAIGLMILFLVLRKLVYEVAPKGVSRRDSTVIAAVGATAVGLSFAWWVASTDGRVNIPPMAWIFGAFFFANRTARSASVRPAFWLGLCIALATLLHQSHGIFLLVGAAAVMLAPTTVSGKLRIARAALAGFLPALVIPYAIAMHLRGIHTLPAALDWTLTYARLGTWWNFDALGNLDADLSALRHAYFADAPHDSDTLPILAAAAAHAILICASCIVMVGLADRAAGRVAERKRRMRRMRKIGLSGVKYGAVDEGTRPRDRLFIVNTLATVWIVGYSAFFTVWSPGYFIFWLPVVAAWTMLLIINASAGPGRRFVVPVASVAAFLFMVTNLCLYVLPHMPPQSNGALMVAESVRTQTPEDALILITGTGYLANMEIYIPYFSERNALSIHQVLQRRGELGPGQLSEDIRRRLRSGKPVYAFGEIYNSPRAWHELRVRYGSSASGMHEALEPFVRRKRFVVGDQPVYQLFNPVRGKNVHPESRRR